MYLKFKSLESKRPWLAVYFRWEELTVPPLSAQWREPIVCVCVWDHVWGRGLMAPFLWVHCTALCSRMTEFTCLRGSVWWLRAGGISGDCSGEKMGSREIWGDEGLSSCIQFILTCYRSKTVLAVCDSVCIWLWFWSVFCRWECASSWFILVGWVECVLVW